MICDCADVGYIYMTDMGYVTVLMHEYDRHEVCVICDCADVR